MPENSREIVPLLGYMDEESARTFVATQCITTKSPEEIASLVKGCRAAALARPGPDLEARTGEIDAAATPLLAEIQRDPRFPKTVKDWKWSFREVEIDKLICIQRYIDVAYAEAISKKVNLSTLDGRVRFCLTDEFRALDSEIMEVPAESMYAIKADGYDLRVTGSEARFDPKTGDRTVSFTVGWGHPYVQVAKLGGRYVLKNGYHRAYALKKRGFDFIPCVLIEASSYDDLECGGPPNCFSERSIMGAHPPVFSALFDPAISPPMKMRAVVKAVVLRPDTSVLDPDAMTGYLENARVEGTQSHPDNLEYTDVRPIHEDWNVYRLADGTTLKMRVILTRVKKDTPYGTRAGADISNVLLVCNPPRGKKGTPTRSRPSREELVAAIVERNVKFKTIQEPMNEYVTPEGKRMVLRLRLYSLTRTRLFDADGDPLYLFDARPDLMVVDK